MVEVHESTVLLALTSTVPRNVERQTFSLYEEVRQLPNISVSMMGEPAGSAPAGSKGADPTTVGALLVSTAASPLIIRQLLTIVQSWVERSAERSVRIRIGDDELELHGAVPKQHKLVEAFLERTRQH